MTTAAALLAAAVLSCGSGGPARNLQEADAEYAAGAYARAERLYQNYIEDNPEGAERWHAWNRLVDIAEGVERDPEKAAALLEAMQLEFEADRQRNLAISMRLARLYEALRKFEQALDTWSKVLELVGPGSAEAAEVYLEMGEIHQLRGEYALAKDTMRECLEAAEDAGLEARCMYGLARYLSLLRNDAQAMVWLERLTAMETVDPELRALGAYMLAGIYTDQGRKDEARRLLISIKDTYPNPKAVEARLRHLAQ